MFVLVTVEDMIRTLPHLMCSKDMYDSTSNPSEMAGEHTRTAVLRDEIEMKYANKVIKDVGLCISLYQFLRIGDGHIHPADGSAHTSVLFHILTFKPHVGEVLVGKVTGCSEEGVHVSLGFFEDVLIPPYALPAFNNSSSSWDEKLNMWVWYYSDVEENAEAATDEDQRFLIQEGEDIRFRVMQLNYTTVTDTVKGMMATTTETAREKAPLRLDRQGSNSSLQSLATVARQRSTSVNFTDSAKPLPAVMQVLGSINDPGLGLTEWW